MRLPVLVSVTLCALCCTATLHAAEPAPGALSTPSMATVARGEPLPAWADPLLPIPPSTSHDALVLRLSEIQVWTGSGPTTVLYNRAIQINHRAGLGEIGQFSVSFLPSHQTLSLHRVAILRGDAVLDRTTTVNARLLERESELDNGTYGGETTVQLLLDDVRVGDTLWVTYTITGDNPVFGTHWGDLFQWDANWPVVQRRLTVSHPARQPLYWRQLGDIKAPALVPVTERRGAIERLRFDGRDLAPVAFENKTPAGFIPVRAIELSDFASWQEVAQWASALFPQRPAAPAVTALAAQFRSAGAPAAQAGAALRWVQDEIRYFSVSIGENSHRPQPPEIVLARRYGDCKDKTYLLISILQALGITAEPVLLSARVPDYPARLQPTQNAFDHAIVRLHVDGKTYVVDPTETDQRGDLDQLAPAFPGASVLVVAPATKALTVLPDPPETIPSYERAEFFKVADFSGAATLASREIFRGARAADARRRFGTMRPVDVANDVLEHYERQYPGVTLAGAPTLVDDAPDGSFEVRARLALPGAVRKVDDRYVLDYDSQVADGTMGLPNKLVRQFPFSFPAGKLYARYRLRVAWPQNVRANGPDNTHLLDHPYFSVRESYSMLGNEIDYLVDYRLKRDQVAAADLPGLQVASRGAQGMLSGTFTSNGGEDEQGVRALSMRDFLAAQQLHALQAARNDETTDQLAQWSVGALCWHMRSAFSTWTLQTADERAATERQLARFRDDARPGASACQGQMAMQRGDAGISLEWFDRDTLAPDDRTRVDISWARWFAGQHDAALQGVMAYVTAALASGKLNGSDVAMATSLHVRAGKPVPAVLANAIVLPPDGPWPAPLLAWQRGALSEAALFQAIAAYAPDAQALARNDAWFHIGERRLASHDAASAATAFRWYRADGVRGTLPFVLAGLEAPVRVSQDPDFLAGSALINNGKLVEGVAAVRKAAERGDVDAQAALGLAYADGRGVPKDRVAARRWLAPAAQSGSAPALATLAVESFRDGPAGKAQALALGEQAAALDSPYAMFYLSELIHRGIAAPHDAPREVELERRAAEMDLKEAQQAQAMRYLNGDHVAKNDDLVRYWARRAIASGNDDGYAALARLLMRGTAEDQRTAVGMVRNLAEAGNGAALRAMGYAAMRGIGQPADQALARTWYTRAQQQAQYPTMLGYSRGLAERENDLDGAFDVTRLLAEAGDPVAQGELAWLYGHGRGTPVDPVQSTRWLRAAVAQGDLTAINNLGDAYETGTGVPIDLPRAMALYRQAAQRGGTAACSSLASVYEKGVGTAPDLRVAYTYLLLRQRFIEAARPGVPVEARALAMAEKLSPSDQAHARAAVLAWQTGQPLPGEAPVVTAGAN